MNLDDMSIKVLELRGALIQQRVRAVGGKMGARKQTGRKQEGVCAEETFRRRAVAMKKPDYESLLRNIHDGEDLEPNTASRMCGITVMDDPVWANTCLRALKWRECGQSKQVMVDSRIATSEVWKRPSCI